MDEYLLPGTNNANITIMNSIQQNLSKALSRQYSDAIMMHDFHTTSGHDIRLYMAIVYSPADWSRKNVSVPHTQAGFKNVVMDLDLITIQQLVNSARIGDANGGHVANIPEVEYDIGALDTAAYKVAQDHLMSMDHSRFAKVPERYVPFADMNKCDREINDSKISVKYANSKLEIYYNERIPMIRTIQQRAPRRQQVLILTNDASKKVIHKLLGRSGIMTDIDDNDDLRNYILLTSDERKVSVVPNVLRIPTITESDVQIRTTTQPLPEIRFRVPRSFEQEVKPDEKMSNPSLKAVPESAANDSQKKDDLKVADDKNKVKAKDESDEKTKVDDSLTPIASLPAETDKKDDDKKCEGKDKRKPWKKKN